MMKNYLLWATFALFNLALLECGASFVLYHYWSHGPTGLVFTGDLASLATIELGQRVGRRLGLDLLWSRAAGRRVSSVPAPFFVPDAELGYTVRPGSCQILIDAGAMKYEFHAHVGPDGSRATSYLPHQASRHLYIFGDSITWG